ncbi:hypothetical protein BDA96_03G143000 [Sorghum bicolor]|uniref:Uncharacterized protein n=1 Tax=Sorghum bicolor TaxID=4558 RepID=A0A921RCI8_SORBI|nr:hypothetical protein BDA96_03G143000 [Sorghum bicolor]
MDLDTLKSRKCYVPCKIRPLPAYPTPTPIFSFPPLLFYYRYFTTPSRLVTFGQHLSMP